MVFTDCGVADEAQNTFCCPLSLDGSMICSTVPPSVHQALSTAGATVKAFAAVTACQTLLPSGANA